MRGHVVAFVREDAIWVVSIDGSALARRLFEAPGDHTDPAWSPDGTSLAVVSNRGDHAFIGVYSNDTTRLVWLSPSSSGDASPRWPPDGKQIVLFDLRLPAAGGPAWTAVPLVQCWPKSTLLPKPLQKHLCFAKVGDQQESATIPDTTSGGLHTESGGQSDTEFFDREFWGRLVKALPTNP